MEEKSLRITGADKTFFNKITSTITKMLIPTKIGINGMVINAKRKALEKAYDNYKEKDDENTNKKYEDAYTAYLETLDKYVLDSIYKKVKNNTATNFEKEALSNYYGIIRLKETEYTEYKYRKQKYLLELDYESIKTGNKEKLIEKYQKFYISKMDTLYKGILKNYSIKLADTTNVYDSTKDWIYIKIFSTLEEYIEKILYLKLNSDNTEELEEIQQEYEKYEKFTVGKLDTRDTIEKNMVLLGLTRKIFTHSLPLIVAEQCYKKLLKDARTLVQDTKIANKRETVYNLLLNLIEEYNSKLVSKRIYWENFGEKEQFKNFWNEYNKIYKLKEIDFEDYMKKKEIVLIKDDMKKLHIEKTDYTKLIIYYKRKLVDYGVMKEIKGYKTNCKNMKKKVNTQCMN